MCTYQCYSCWMLFVKFSYESVSHRIPANTNLMFFFNFQYGDTPLHTSARYGHAGVTRILISAHCHVSDQNKVKIFFFYSFLEFHLITFDFHGQLNCCPSLSSCSF